MKNVRLKAIRVGACAIAVSLAASVVGAMPAAEATTAQPAQDVEVLSLDVNPHDMDKRPDDKKDKRPDDKKDKRPDDKKDKRPDDKKPPVKLKVDFKFLLKLLIHFRIRF